MVYFSDVDDDGEIATEEQTSASGEAAEVLQRNYYYPFGLRVDAPVYQSLGDPVNRYLYNGKELQGEGELEIGWLYYGARMYDPAVGRFTGVDPLADDPEQVDKSPFAYTWNNPIRYTDPFGLKPEDDYKLNKDGTVELIRQTSDDNDVLYGADASVNENTGEVEGTKIGEVNKGFLKDGQNLSTDVNMTRGKTKDDLHSYLELTLNISKHVDKEIGFLMTSSNNLVLFPYEKNTFRSEAGMQKFVKDYVSGYQNGVFHLKKGNSLGLSFFSVVAHGHIQPGGGRKGFGTANPSPADKSLYRLYNLPGVIIGGRNGDISITSPNGTTELWTN